MFFYGTICHVCKSNQNVKRCGGCKMIAYCSTKHQKCHWPDHKKLCKCINATLVKYGLSSLFEDARLGTLPEEWVSIRTNSMALIELSLGNKLSPEEQQMFMFPRTCEICHESKQDKLQDCQKCFCVSYCCTSHQAKDFQRHKLSCSWLYICLQLDIHLLHNEHPYPSFVVPMKKQYALLPLNIDMFISNFVGENCLNATNTLNLALLSEILTCPLTLLYSLQKSGTVIGQELNIHIVGASELECTFLQSWEVVMHWLPQVKHLQLQFIGPDISESLKNQDVTSTLCIQCANKIDNVIHLDFHTNFYHDYVNLESFTVPHAIIMYNCGLHEFQGTANDTWLESIPHLGKFKGIPLILTSYTRDEAEKDISRIGCLLKQNTEALLHCQKNPFGSKRPYRDWANNEINLFFQNNYISIVKTV